MEYLFNEITVQNDPKLEKEIDIQVQKTLKIPNTCLGKDSWFKHKAKSTVSNQIGALSSLGNQSDKMVANIPSRRNKDQKRRGFTDQ